MPPKNKINKKLIEQFEKVNFKHLYEDLFKNTIIWINVNRIFGFSKDDIYDIILGAIENLLTGQNVWDFKAYPNPYITLKKNVIRDLCNEITRRTKSLEYKNLMNPDELDNYSDSNEQIIITPTENANDYFKSKLEFITKACEHDDDASYMLEVMISEQITEHQKIADYCEWSVGKVRTIFKRIHRKIKSYEKKTGKNHDK